MDAEHNQIPKQDFDRWLDGALRARAEAEPRTGLEDRILARLATETPRKSFVWWPVLAGVAALLVIAAAIVLMSTERTAPGVVTHSDQTQNPSNAANPAVQARAVPRQGAHRGTHRPRGKAVHCCAMLASRSIGSSEPLPKLPVFPTPRPETEQEHLLFRLAAQQGSYETASLNHDLPIRELSIPEIKITPMERTPPDNSPQQ